MRIKTYEYWDPPGGPNWHFSKVHLGRVSLLVGDTATGKTRFLNTLFNLGKCAVSESIGTAGKWRVDFCQNTVDYSWDFEVSLLPSQDPQVERDKLSRLQPDGSIEVLIDRTRTSFLFKGNKLPKLSPTMSSISLLKEEEIIQPIHKGFASIMRRNFSANSPNVAGSYQTLTTDLNQRIEKERVSLEEMFSADYGISLKLFILSRLFPSLYKDIIRQFKAVFPFVVDVSILDLNQFHKSLPLPFTPTFCIKERRSTEWIDHNSLSSGMQKVLLIITDLVLLPNDGIYLIDEYENSLGVNAIDFFPETLLTSTKDYQIILTSHHPYIINKIPVDNWFIFQRTGQEVSVKYGAEVKQRFGKSKQQAFLQLLNDSGYSRGVE